MECCRASADALLLTWAFLPPQLPDGSTLALPKVATARFGSDPNKRTVCVYGHVDVQPAKLEDGWATEPYNLTDVNGNRRTLHLC